ncbi:hypothetical protein N1F89_03285 [Aquibium sp. A9E412]|uniref:hypothetical protein n=1 Tax=Aquibium sp. A9E412 TaxID=2976767 RepID=UPI0025AF2C36|nr:hypothetical protein [Aquibium sp. A9E412]MDN2565233.1 hypothetical protein [Aquibium sp. A9E412]
MIVILDHRNVDNDAVVDAVRDVDVAADIRHAHLRQMEEHAAAPDTHVVVEEKAWDRLEEIKRTIKRVLEEVQHHSLDARVPA